MELTAKDKKELRQLQIMLSHQMETLERILEKVEAPKSQPVKRVSKKAERRAYWENYLLTR